ncbi:DUF1652 domain-containing protein [Pseudomonas sp. D5002]|uniref:DUF1652 domain-containing protein n=1 Tax=Pseudomonas sp. D5002 TaxID=2738818 RepID=UPI0015A44484|nr:DUF1652 domain-containing protein [Pseudomonas sp. D5002]NWB12328.1 DUF1652 domain-containing protein [Pseudomonas sp. D5002]
MISALELRHIIECGFVPLSCRCTVNPDGSLMIKVFEPASGRIDLLVTSVTTDGLTSSRAIANLIGELRSEMSERSVSFSEVRRAGSRKTESFSK